MLRALLFYFSEEVKPIYVRQYLNEKLRSMVLRRIQGLIWPTTLRNDFKLGGTLGEVFQGSTISGDRMCNKLSKISKNNGWAWIDIPWY